MTLLRRLGLSFGFALLPCIAQAAPCSGFSDVDSASGFCPNVDWLRNRGVTLGCTATTYCPDEPVTRLQMAAFMNRLGTAFTPMILYANASGPVTFTNSIGYICMTADVPVFDFRRFASAISTVTFVAFGPASYMESRPVISSDAGATWQPFDASASGNDFVQSVFNSEHAGTTTAITREAAIFQASYRFAIEVIAPGVGSTSITHSCQLRVSITNRNGTNVPY